MKRFYLFLLTILALSALQLKAQYTGCNGNCPETWNENQVAYVNEGNCHLEIHYSCRVACGTDYEYRIDRIDYTGDCSFLSERHILDIASIAIIQRDPYPVDCNYPKPLLPFDCITSIRVNYRSCWRFWPEGSQIAPCASANYGLNDCCWTTYKICLDDVGRAVISVEDEGQPLPDCGLTDPPGCKAVCD